MGCTTGSLHAFWQRFHSLSIPPVVEVFTFPVATWPEKLPRLVVTFQVTVPGPTTLKWKLKNVFAPDDVSDAGPTSPSWAEMLTLFTTAETLPGST